MEDIYDEKDYGIYRINEIIYAEDSDELMEYINIIGYAESQLSKGAYLFDDEYGLYIYSGEDEVVKELVNHTKLKQTEDIDIEMR